MCSVCLFCVGLNSVRQNVEEFGFDKKKISIQTLDMYRLNEP